MHRIQPSVHITTTTWRLPLVHHAHAAVARTRANSTTHSAARTAAMQLPQRHHSHAGLQLQRSQQQLAHVGLGGSSCVQRHSRAPRPQQAHHHHALHGRQHFQSVSALHIDHRHHMEMAWKRQQERDELLKRGAAVGQVTEVADLQHLESLVDKAGSSLVVVFFYTRSCGVCKELLKDFAQLCEEAKQQQVRAVFARHNLIDDFDSWSDVSVWHRIRVAPTILFYDEGAVVRKITLHDVRRMGEHASSIREAMQQDLGHMRALFRQTVFERAPGARS